MKLTPIELQSAVWLKLQAHLNDRLQALRCQNDGDLTMEQTIKLRGRAAQLKELLALGQPGPEQAEVDD
jgi:hypothetical protein